jgi:hypothetical protein
MRWKDIETNFKLFRAFAPRAHFEVYPAVSVMNCFHLPDAIDRWLELGMVHEGNRLELNFVKEPAFYSIKILNREERAKLEERYALYCDGLEGRLAPELSARIRAELERLLAWAGSESLEAERGRFRQAMLALDKSRGESFAALFPELSGLMG